MKKLLLSFAMLASISLCMAQTSGWQNLGDTVVYTYAKVGINTTAPKEALEINGYIRGEGPAGALRINTDYGITTIGAVSGNYSHFNTTNPRFYFYKPVMVEGGKISSSHNTNLSLQTFYYDGSSLEPTTRMTILNSNGYVGIGKTSPIYKLDVAGKIHASDSIIAPFVYSSGDAYVGGRVTANIVRTNTITVNNTMGRLTINASPLVVNGTLKAREIIVNSSGADYVFDKDYHLRSLDDVNLYIQEHQHLPEIPSAKQMQEDGMSVEQMVVKLLQKVEELTLYTIQQEERIKELEKNQR